MISQSETNRYNTAFGNDYYFPMELEDRFITLSDKVTGLFEDPDHHEAAIGYKMVFLDEFKIYKVEFFKGSIWKKKTESWIGNDPKGTFVKIRKVKGSFIWYSKGFFEQRYCLNKWTFLGLFERST